jgi:hypothetical protein
VSALKSKDDLVIQVADRHGLEKRGPQRALLKGPGFELGAT